MPSGLEGPTGVSSWGFVTWAAAKHIADTTSILTGTRILSNIIGRLASELIKEEPPNLLMEEQLLLRSSRIAGQHHVLLDGACDRFH